MKAHEGWRLAGSTYQPNPIKVIVKAAPLSPDMYEANDTEDSPYVLVPNYSGNSATVDTEGSNSHTGNDNDFYKVVLEAGFDYNIIARVHDSYNSGNQEIYSNDVIWTYAVDGEWSELYDDVMQNSIVLSDGGELLFGVGPYYEGQTGTYLLDIQIARTETVSSRPLENENLKIYPNPATDLIQIESTGVIDRVKIYDIKGRVVRTIDTNSPQVSTNIAGLSEGVYLLHVTLEDHTSVYKIVKQ